MNLVLQNLRLPLAHFVLEANAVLAGRVTALFGPSGAGKTSLLEVVAGLRRPASGAVRLDDTVLVDVTAGTHLSPARRAIGYLPQDGALFPHLSVRKNLNYGFDPKRPSDAGPTFTHVVEALEISPLLDRAPVTLSGGEKQRVALGRALLAAPRLLLLDEPLVGLDAGLKDRLMPYFQLVRDEFRIPVLYVTHSPDEVVALCDDVLLLEQGKITRQGPPLAFFAPDESPSYRLVVRP